MQKEHKLPLFVRIILWIIGIFVGFIVLIFALNYMIERGNNTRSTHERTRIENPNKFNENCIYDPGNNMWFSSNSQSAVVNSMLRFYERTGAQLYLVYFDIRGEEFNNYFKDSEEVRKYCLQKIRDEIGADDYSIVIWRTNYSKSYYGTGEYDYNSIGLSDTQFSFGDELSEFFDSEGRSILTSRVSDKVRYSSYEELPKVLDEASDELLGYHNTKVMRVLYVVVILGLMILLSREALKKKN